MRLILRILSALVITVAVLVGVLLLLPGEKVAGLAADQIEAQTGRRLTFQGKVRFTLWPSIGVKSEGVTLSNAPWAGPDPMLEAQQLSIGISAADLLRGKVRVTEVSALLPKLNLSENAEGQGNWVLATSEESKVAVAAENQDAVLPISIEKLSLVGASLRYQPHQGDVVEMSGMDATLKWPDPSGTVDLDLILRPAGEPVAVQAEIGTFAAFLGGQVSSVGATVTVGENLVRFDGRAGLDGAVSGRMTAKTRGTETFLAALGLPDIAVPKGFGQNAEIGSDLTYTPDGRIALRDLAVKLDGNLLQGAADVTLGEVPTFTAQLVGDELTFPGLAPSGPGGIDTGGTQEGGWSRDPIDMSALGVANGTAVLTFNRLNAAGYSLGPSKLSLGMENARAVLKLQPASLFGGKVTGRLVANNRKGFSTRVEVSFSGLRLEQALGQLAEYDRLNGEALGEISVLASGNSLHALMNSLKGKGWLEVGKGFFTGFDLEGLMRTGQGNGGSTVFEQLTGSYTLTKGNLKNDDLLITLKAFKAEGAGRIGIGARDLDYLFTPTALGVNGGEGLSIPVKITGSWDDPRIRPDLKQVLQPEIDAIEEDVKEQVREKLEQELETEIAPEADINEVIKNRIEEQAKEQLLRLLQGN